MIVRPIPARTVHPLTPSPGRRQFLSSSRNEHAAVRAELERWQRQYTDVEELWRQLQQEREQTARLRQHRDQLRDDVKVPPHPAHRRQNGDVVRFAAEIRLFIELLALW